MADFILARISLRESNSLIGFNGTMCRVQWENFLNYIYVPDCHSNDVHLEIRDPFIFRTSSDCFSVYGVYLPLQDFVKNYSSEYVIQEDMYLQRNHITRFNRLYTNDFSNYSSDA